MRMLSMCTIVLVLLMACTAVAFELEDKYPVKSRSMPSPNVDGDKRVGGDTVDDAVAILSLPFGDSGSTCGFTDNYDAICPFESTSPDVVYSFVPTTDLHVDIDLCGSIYDTKLFILDVNLDVIACCDDYYVDASDPCGQWVSKLESMPFSGGVTYFIVIDGWGGECGEYELAISEMAPCPLDCPVEGIPEGEPALADGYDDYYNGGCIYDWLNPLDSVITILGQGNNQAVVCGSGGYWRDHPNYPNIPYYWDDDWYEVIPESSSAVTVTLEAQRQIILHEITLPDGDCDQAVYLQSVFVSPCKPITITALGIPSRPLYFWVQSVFQTYPDYEIPYLLTFDGIKNDPVAIEATSWSHLKCIFR